MRILPFLSRSNPERELQRRHDDLADDARSSLAVLHQAMVESASLIREMKAIGSKEAAALDAARRWASRNIGGSEDLDLALVSPKMQTDDGALLTRDGVAEMIVAASAAAVDCRFARTSGERLQRINEHAPMIAKAVAACRAAYVDRAQAAAYPPLSTRVLQISGGPQGPSGERVRTADERLRDVYAEALGSMIDQPMKSKVENLEHALRATATLIERAVEASDLAAQAEAEAEAAQRDADQDCETDPCM